MFAINIEPNRVHSVEEDNVEIVERKGFGHPDTICNSIVDQVSIDYFRNWKAHHNFDKALLSAGKTKPAFGGGEIIRSPTFCLGDRATIIINGKPVDVETLVKSTIDGWFENNMPLFPKPIYHSYLSEGSGNLIDIFNRDTNKFLPANDTSAATGYAPFSMTEKLTLDLEGFLNSPNFKSCYPCSGQDIKVMAVRNGNKVNITVAMAIIDRYIISVKEYKRRIDEMTVDALDFCQKQYPSIVPTLRINALDNYKRGIDGLYLTVSGSSAECGDSGQVGRGNNPVGVITLNRPMSVEAAAGKNSVSHIGKIYNHFCFYLSNKIYDTYKEKDLNTVYVWMVSQIGRPINEPIIIYVKHDGGELTSEITELITKEMMNLDKFCLDLASGKRRSI
jgi:S-adenosylmethionine synthetase